MLKKRPAKKGSAGSDELGWFEELVATIAEVKRKGDANPYTSLNGNMFTLLAGSKRLAIRLPKAERENFLKKYKTNLFEVYGAVMPQYVAVPAELLPKAGELRKYFEISYEYAKKLKAKPSKKESKA